MIGYDEQPTAAVTDPLKELRRKKMKAILGKKVGMTQIFSEAGEIIPVTVIEAGPAVVTQIKTVETDGYYGVQIGFEDKKTSRVIKPEAGHFKKAGVSAKKHLAEFRPEEGDAFELGQAITVADFEEGTKLDITGTSKGKGTQGNIKRNHHRRGPMSHGSKHKRLPGGLAAATYPSRVFLGNEGPGRTGRDTVTVQNLVLVKTIADRNLMLVKGAVPGNKGGLLKIRTAVKGQ
jgi:large subunit ribosomal protein L3